MNSAPARLTTALTLLALALSPELAAQAPAPSDGPPDWAYPVRPAGATPIPINFFAAPDWHPAEHSPMPAIVARGRKPAVFACGLCHRADGAGGPENASLAGLTADYMTRQVADFRSGARTGAEPRRLPTALMATIARAATDSEITIAVRYFAAQHLASRIAVIESDSVPRTHVTGWLLATTTGAWEPTGQRIVEVPEDLQQFERRDTRALFLAYVPVGSIAKGSTIAATGNGGRVAPCATCHGPALHGLDPAPGIAGRSPTYIVRQLYDFKHGARAGTASAPMRLVAEQLDLDDMIAVAAFVASLPP